MDPSMQPIVTPISAFSPKRFRKALQYRAAMNPAIVNSPRTEPNRNGSTPSMMKKNGRKPTKGAMVKARDSE